MNAVAKPIALTNEQRADLATLLSRTIINRNLGWLGKTLTGVDVLTESPNQIGDALGIAQSLVKLIEAKAVLDDAVALLEQEFSNNLYLKAGLAAILRGERLDNPNLQQLLNRYEPFFNSADFQEMLPRVRGTVCAVAGGGNLLGTGFLVGPAHVLTNFHVLRNFIRRAANGVEYEQAVPGTDICCVFDYRTEPPPKLGNKASEDSRVLVVPAADQWLVNAREPLPDDGTAKAPAKVNTEYDYVLIELARPVGQKPARVGGGALRGWLSLPPKDRQYVPNERVILFQHPQGAAQQFDIGEVHNLDPSGTRVWYWVSSAHGSSGGAAVANDGTLLALHNAKVDSPPGPTDRPVNQGVCITLIAKDLEDVTKKWKTPPRPEEHPLAFWSLTDSVRDPKPIIGRQQFRDAVTKMMKDKHERLLAVVGGYGTFVGFSLSLLERTLGKLVPIARFSPDDMQVKTPPEFVTSILEQLGVEIDDQDPLPLSAPPTETPERWLRIYLPQWVGRQLARHEKNRPGVFPAWVAIDSTAPKIAPPLWAKGLRELVVAMCGGQDAGQTDDVPQLRWLLMSSVPLPLGTLHRIEEDLRNDDDASYTRDFAACMTVAWLTIDKEAENTESIFFSVASEALYDNSQLAKPILPRKLLAQKAIKMIKFARGK